VLLVNSFYCPRCFVNIEFKGKIFNLFSTTSLAARDNGVRQRTLYLRDPTAEITSRCAERTRI